MKKLLATAVLVFASAIAWAVPSPKQVESALAAHDYRAARSMVDEVLRAQPQSARAHLLNSYVLLKEGKVEVAANEVKTARQLDTKGDVVGSALFGRTVAEIDMAKQKTVAAAPAYVPPPQPVQQAFVPPPVQAAPVQPDSGHGFFFWAFILALLGGAGYGIYRFLNKKPKADEFEMPSPDIAPIPSAPTPYESPVPVASSSAYQPAFRQSPYPTPAPAPAPTAAPQASRRSPTPTPYPTPAPLQAPTAAPQVVVVHDRNDSSVLGTVAAAGVGVLAADALLNAGRHRRDEEDAYQRGRRDAYSSGSSSNNWGTPAPAVYSTPEPAPAPVPAVDYESERESFSSSNRRDDSWSTPSPAPAPEPEPERYSSSSSSSDSWSSSDSSSSSSDSSSSSSSSDW